MKNKKLEECVKKQIEINQVISDLEALFKIGENSGFKSMRNGRKFFINKQQFERFEVIGMLQEYFADKFIEGGYLLVDSITFVFTSFEILEGKPNNYKSIN